jgi:RND family efflux transporter MFP subunit
MRPARPPRPKSPERGRLKSVACAAIPPLAFLALAGCEQNTYVPPPPAKVEVAVPLQRPITRYLDATGNTAPIKSVDLVARVQGFLESINYKDGTFVKEGTILFTIEPETYKLKLDQARAAEAGAQASLHQAELDFRRQSDLVARQAVSQATLDTSTSNRDNAQASLQQAQANTRIAEVNYGYTKVAAPFDGFVTAHLISVGELVGAASPTQLASIVALDPIYVNFNVNEQDVLRIRAEAARRGVSVAELRQLPVEVGYRTRRVIRTRASSITSRPRSTRRPEHCRCAASCPIRIARCCPVLSSASAFPTSNRATRCWCLTPRSVPIRAGATCWW